VRVSIRPLGDVPRDVLEDLVEDLKDMGSATVLEPRPLDPGWFDGGRGQYRGDPILDALAPDPGDRVLGVTASDLFSGTYNFVFGLARVYGGPAVVSIARLGSPDLARHRERIAKEAIHELGHTLGADNCPNRECVMSFSNSVEEVDRKTRYFCRRCTPTIEFSAKRLRP
jgi:archaemetzincin